MSWFGNDEKEGMTNAFVPDLGGAGQTNLGNSNMMNIPKDDSAMNLVNDPSTKEAFNLGSAPIPPPRKGLRKAMPKFNRAVGDIQWKTGETWGVLIGGIAIGMVALSVWNRATR
tara:strand:+ start:139 stop:480 length:342 start_codon:yes stop_codon:yes gene_type:complete